MRGPSKSGLVKRMEERLRPRSSTILHIYTNSREFLKFAMSGRLKVVIVVDRFSRERTRLHLSGLCAPKWLDFTSG